MMSGKTRPNGRNCMLAQAALATLNEQESREKEVAAIPALALAPVWREAKDGAIRLIDLERRARFARLALEAN